MNARMAAAALLMAPIAACAVATPPENLDRRISFNWSLTPESVEPARRTVESGDIILSWKAEAKATHVMNGPSGPTPLVMARTNYGNLYCSSDTCYEDRNGDGALDHSWSLSRGSATALLPRVVTAPKPLTAPIIFHSAEAGSGIVYQRFLGLVYTGPLEGVPKGEQLLPMVGELDLGWHLGANAPRTPDGKGWLAQQRLPLLLGDGFNPSTIVSPLGLTYQPFHATLDGTLDLETKAKRVDNINLDEKLKLDVEKDPKQSGPPILLPQT